MPADKGLILKYVASNVKDLTFVKVKLLGERTMVNNKKMTKFNEFSILLIPVVWFFCGTAVAPALGAIGQQFPTASEFELKLILTITSFSSVFFSLISGKLAKHIDKKILVMAGLFIYGVCGVSTTFCTTINQILFVRFITGVGVGLVVPLPGAIISQNFDGEKRSRLLGLCTSTANISNVLVSIVVGLLLAYGWKYPFYTFAFSFVLFFTTLIGVPSAPPVKNITENKVSGSKEKLTGKIYLLALFMILAWMTHAVLTTNLALFWTKENIGPVTMIGLAISLPALASILVGAIYPELKRLFKKYLTFVALIAFGLTFVLLYSAHSIPVVFAGCIFEGMGFGIIMPLIMDATAKTATDGQKDAAFGLVSGCMHLGGFISPFVQVIYTSVGNNSSIRFIFLVAAIEIAVAAVISIVTAMRMKDIKASLA